MGVLRTDHQRHRDRQGKTISLVVEKTDEIRNFLKNLELAVFLDYDGTLTPIASTPSGALLADEMKIALDRLSALCPVAIISGRDKGLLKTLIGLDQITYAGSHGLEIDGPQGSGISYDVGKPFSGAVQCLADRLEYSLANIPGILVERTAYTVAVHYRLTPPQLMKKVEDLLQQALLEYPNFKKTLGKMVFEIRPKIEWDKGMALAWILDSICAEGATRVPIYVGDDLTDEDAFRVTCDRGLGLLVSENSKKTYADYMLRNTTEVLWFLEWISSDLQRRESVNR